MNRLNFILLIAISAAASLLTSCTTMSHGSSAGRPTNLDPNDPQLLARRAQIRAEQPGNYYIGRRYWLEGTRFWGFLRRPGQQWDDARLVIMNENVKKQPDRLPESNPGGNSHGYDHNYEYKIRGNFTGHKVYDPNSNQELPEFILRDYELVSRNPGFLFHPRQVFEAKRVPKPPLYR